MKNRLIWSVFIGFVIRSTISTLGYLIRYNFQFNFIRRDFVSECLCVTYGNMVKR